MSKEYFMAAVVRTQYQTARVLARLVSVGGWLITAFGLIAIVGVLIDYFGVSKVALRGENGAPYSTMTGLEVCFILIMIGFVLAAYGQLLRATVDTADNTREMLEIMRS